MQFELKTDVPPADSIVETIRALLDYAHACLEKKDADLNIAVHEVRKSLKRLRAILRLVRPVLDSKSFQTADRAVRDLGRRLGGARDSAVLLVSFDRLADYYTPFLCAEGMQPVRDNLESQYQSAMDAFLVNIDVHSLEEQLEGLRQRLDALDLTGFTRHMLFASVRKTYRAGRRALRALHEEPTTRHSHALRRHAKYLWFQLLLLRNWNPAVLEPVVADLDELGEVLGQDHDLAMLADTLNAHPEIVDNRIRGELLNGLVESRRIALLAAGLRTADTVYAIRPARFISQLESAIPI